MREQYVDFERLIMELVLLAITGTILLFGAVSDARAGEPSTSFKLCTGKEDGNYFAAGQRFKKQSTSVVVDVKPTQGSLDNLDQLVAGTCDGAFVQSDAMLVYSAHNARAISYIERAGVLYAEHVHLICNRDANIDRIVKLTKNNTILVGPEGAGARVTWDAFITADKKRYGVVKTDPRTGVRGLAAVADGNDAQCLLWVGALNSTFLRDDAAKQASRLVLVPTDDWDMGGAAKDARGAAVYGYGEIPADTYGPLMPAGSLYGHRAVKDITVDALFVTRVDWINANETAYDKLLRAFAAAKPSIQELVRPK